jgi:hypothetical protein
MLTDGRLDMTKLIVAFRDFLKAPKIKFCQKFNDEFSRCFFFGGGEGGRPQAS